MDRIELVGNWNYPTTMRFCVGRIAELADACRSLGMKKPLLVTDPGLAELPMIAKAVTANLDDGLPTGLYTGVRPNPLGSNVSDGVEVFNTGNHDGVIAFGGGSAMDVGKLIAFAAGQIRPLWDFEDVDDNWLRADAKAIAPVVAVPTT